LVDGDAEGTAYARREACAAIAVCAQFGMEEREEAGAKKQ